MHLQRDGSNKKTAHLDGLHRHFSRDGLHIVYSCMFNALAKRWEQQNNRTSGWIAPSLQQRWFAYCVFLHVQCTCEEMGATKKPLIWMDCTVISAEMVCVSCIPACSMDLRTDVRGKIRRSSGLMSPSLQQRWFAEDAVPSKSKLENHITWSPT